jgi:glycosyltransferase involved in cell wall biosynthesis
MISFVWSSKYPFLAGAGGSENYTAGQIRELQKRGIEARLLTIGHGRHDGRKYFPDIQFKDLASKEELSDLDDTLIFITYPLNVSTKHPSYAILHCPPPNFARGDFQYDKGAFRGKRLITTSKYAAGLWRKYLKVQATRMPTVYPFAERPFAEVKRPALKSKSAKTKILYAGRLTPDKGIYTLLSALHMEPFQALDYQLTVTTAGAHTDEGRIILPLVQAHPLVKVVPAPANAAAMAKLMAKNDIVVMPSTSLFWQEMFGIVSIEAQHSGCRVVASRSGGLPETNIGGLMLTKPDDPNALARSIAQAAALGPLTQAERQRAQQRFTVEESVDSLLKVIGYDAPQKRRLRLHGPAKLLPRFQFP